MIIELFKSEYQFCFCDFKNICNIWAVKRLIGLQVYIIIRRSIMFDSVLYCQQVIQKSDAGR